MAFHLLGSYENNLPSITINQVFFLLKNCTVPQKVDGS